MAGILTASLLRDAQDLLECLHVPHRVVDGIVVMGCPSEPLPALCLAPVAVEAGPEVADAAAGVPERIGHSSPVEHASYPLPVVGRVVAHKDRPAVADVPLEPGRAALGNFPIGRDALADDADSRVVRVRRRVEQAPVERVPRVVVNGARTRSARRAPDWCRVPHSRRISMVSCRSWCPHYPSGEARAVQGQGHGKVVNRGCGLRCRNEG